MKYLHCYINDECILLYCVKRYFFSEVQCSFLCFVINLKKMALSNSVYEFVNSQKFQQDMWGDLLSSINEMPSYKHLKDMMNSLITEKIEKININSNDAAYLSRERHLFPELTITAFTIDAIVSELLNKKLHLEWKCIVDKIVAECCPDEKSNSIELFENVDAIFESNGDSELRKSKLRSPKKSVCSKPRTTNNEPVLLQCMNTDECDSSSKKTQLSNCDINQNDSVCSYVDDDLSSVHTSELSSFEDEISISSDDGENIIKKTVPLKIATELYAQNKLSEIYKSFKKKDADKDVITPPKKRWKNSFHDKPSTSSEYTSQWRRKQNSKYYLDNATYFSSQSLSPHQTHIKLPVHSSNSNNSNESRSFLPGSTHSPKNKNLNSQKCASLRMASHDDQADDLFFSEAKYKVQRKRKPNSKYFSKTSTYVSPNKLLSTYKDSVSDSTSSSMPDYLNKKINNAVSSTTKCTMQRIRKPNSKYYSTTLTNFSPQKLPVTYPSTKSDLLINNVSKLDYKTNEKKIILEKKGRNSSMPPNQEIDNEISSITNSTQRIRKPNSKYFLKTPTYFSQQKLSATNEGSPSLSTLKNFSEATSLKSNLQNINNKTRNVKDIQKHNVFKLVPNKQRKNKNYNHAEHVERKRQKR